MKDFMQFNIDNFKIIRQDPQFMLLRAYIVSEGTNLHDVYFTKNSIEKAMPSLMNKPIVAIYDNITNDFDDHARTEYQETIRKAVGSIPESNNAKIEEYQGKNFLVSDFIIWKKYEPKVAKRLEENPNVKLSMEIDISKTSTMDNGMVSIDDWSFAGISLLGDNKTPAIPNAGAEVFKFSKDEDEDFKNKAKEFNELFSEVVDLESEEEIVEEIEEFAEKDVPEKYKELNFKIPKGVKENAQKALELRKEYDRGGTSVGINTARYLIKNTHASPEKVRHIAKYFPRHEGDNLDETGADGNPPSNGYIAWLLWGGHEAWRWSEKLVNKMNEIDEKENFAVSEEEIGKDEKLVVALSKEDADFETDWGTVDKTQLRDNLMKASNYKSLIPKSYLVVEEGWEDAPSQHLKYPIVMIKDKTVIYSAKGAQVALSYLEKETEASYYETAKSKLKKVYEKLGLSIENFAKEEYSLDFIDIMNLLEKLIQEKNVNEYNMPSMYVESCDKEYVYVYSLEDGKVYKMKYMPEGELYTVDFESKKEVFRATNYLDMESEDKEVNMIDMGAKMYSDFKAKAKEYQDNVLEFSKVKEQLDTANANLQELNKEKEVLVEFKMSIEKEKKQDKADKLYEKYSDYITEKQKEELNKSLFSYDNFEDFKGRVMTIVVPAMEDVLRSDEHKPSHQDDKIDINFSNLTKPIVEDDKSNKDPLDEYLNR